VDASVSSHFVDGHVTLTSCTIHNNEIGVDVSSDYLSSFNGNLRDNTIQDNRDIGLRITGASDYDVDVTGTAFHANKSDVRTYHGARMPRGFKHVISTRK